MLIKHKDRIVKSLIKFNYIINIIKKNNHNMVWLDAAHIRECTINQRVAQVQWLPVLTEDLEAFHDIDAEAELTALLSEQIAAEIDREIQNSLFFTVPNIIIDEENEKISLNTNFYDKLNGIIPQNILITIIDDLINGILLKYGYDKYLNYSKITQIN